MEGIIRLHEKVMAGVPPAYQIRGVAELVSYEGVPGLVETREALRRDDARRRPGARGRGVHCTCATSRASTCCVDITADRLPRLGGGRRRRLLRHGRGRDLNEPAAQGYARTPEPKPKRFTLSYHLLRVADDSARVRVQVWLDDGETVATVVPVWPTADWHEREAWDMMGIAFDGHPNLDPDPDGRRLGRAPAAQGLSDRRRAGALLGGGVMATVVRAAVQAALRSTPARGSRSPMPTVLKTDPSARGRPHRQLRPEPPLHARRAAADRRPARRARRRARGGDRLPAHRLREDDGAEDVVEGRHLSGPRRLRLLPVQRARLRARGREAARSSRCRARRPGCGWRSAS